MAFTCYGEIEIAGGAEAERRGAAAVIAATDSVQEDSVSLREAEGGPGSPPPPSLILRFESADGLPEDELQAIATQFPALDFTLVYYSMDGEFFGWAAAGAEGSSSESEDFDEDTRDLIGHRHLGDGIAFVKERFGLERRSRPS